jgi:hypothetical protein
MKKSKSTSWMMTTVEKERFDSIKPDEEIYSSRQIMIAVKNYSSLLQEYIDYNNETKKRKVIE